MDRDPVSVKRSRRWMALRILAYLLFFAVVLPGAVCARWIFMPVLPLEQDPGDFGLSFLPVSFTTADGIEIKGWFIPPEQAQSPRSRPLVVLLHGLGANRSQMLPYAALAAKEGYPSLLFDFRAHGQSGGSRTTIGWDERQDLAAALDFAREKLARRTFILWGVSMGAATAALTAPGRDDIHAMILESPYDTLRNTIRHHASLYFHLPQVVYEPLEVAWFQWLSGVKVDAVSPRDSLARMDAGVPLLLVGSQEDERMPPSLVESVARAANAQLRRVWISDTGPHAGIMYVNPEQYRMQVRRFLDDAGDFIRRARPGEIPAITPGLPAPAERHAP